MSENTDSSRPPARLPDGKENPEYGKWYRAKRRAAGNPVKSSLYNPVQAKKYRATPKGKATVNRWNDSEKGRASRAKYEARKKEERHAQRPDRAEAYASRIICELEESPSPEDLA